MARYIKRYKCTFYKTSLFKFTKYNKINDAYRKLLSYEDDDLLLRTVAHTGNYILQFYFKPFLFRDNCGYH